MRPISAPVRWIRPPTNGATCSFSGLGHAAFYGKLLGEFGQTFVHVHLKASGKTKGTHLVFAPSLQRLLVGLAKNQGNSLIPDLIRTRFDDIANDTIEHGWLRAPVNGRRCPFTGLSHGAFYSLLNQAGRRVLVSQLKRPGESRASRLVWIPSLHAYLVERAHDQVG